METEDSNTGCDSRWNQRQALGWQPDKDDNAEHSEKRQETG